MYRIYTEYTHPQRLYRILHKYLPAFTLIRARGAWKGHSEPSAVIEIEKASKSIVYSVAKDIKRENHQESVMVTHTPDTAKFV